MNQSSPLWTTNTSEVRMTGTWRSASPDYRTAPSPCHGACPVNGEIATWIQQIKNTDFEGAWATLVENNPFPAIAGRICHHPCEGACNRQSLDETVGICNLERFIGDMAIAEDWQYPVPEKQLDKTVAIVGGGPAGLSAAYQLGRKGYKVELYESKEQLGGLMRYGIPAYRLDKTVLDAEIQRIIKLGIKVNYQSDVSGSESLEKLREKYDAVFLATGAARSKALPGLDYNQPWVMDSAAFLAATNAGKNCTLGERLLVVGGGSAAMDVARTARRLGKEVIVLSLEPDELLPAQRLEVDEAKEEGIAFISASMMQSAATKGAGVIINCIKIDFKPGEKRGEFSLEPIQGSEFELVVDGIIPSIGQDADLAVWEGLLQQDGPVIKTDSKWQTSLPGVFAGGDFATMDRFVTQAIGMGKQAAIAIDQYVNQQQITGDSATEPEVPFAAINTYYHPEVNQHQAENAAVEIRLQSFDEVQQPLLHDQAVAESARCFSCGNCIFCDSCFFHCPDMAITKLEKGYEVKRDYCKGCGLCVAECPTGAITMREGL